MCALTQTHHYCHQCQDHTSAIFLTGWRMRVRGVSQGCQPATPLTQRDRVRRETMANHSPFLKWICGAAPPFLPKPKSNPEVPITHTIPPKSSPLPGLEQITTAGREEPIPEGRPITVEKAPQERGRLQGADPIPLFWVCRSVASSSVARGVKKRKGTAPVLLPSPAGCRQSWRICPSKKVEPCTVSVPRYPPEGAGRWTGVRERWVADTNGIEAS